MFNFDEETKSVSENNKMLREMMKMISNAMLEADGVPESHKTVIRLINVRDAVIEAIDKAMPEETLRDYENINAKNAKLLCFFLYTVAEQIESHSQNYPLNAKEDNNNEL